MDIICAGLMVCDIIVKPVTGELFRRDSMPVEQVQILPGGDACNVACNAAALGMRTAVVSAAGRDQNGEMIRRYLREHGVDDTHVVDSPHFGTATSVVMVEPCGERHFLSYTRPFEDLHPHHVTRELLKGAKVLSLNSLYRLPNFDDGGAVSAFRLAHELGVLTAVDTAWNRQGAWLPRIEEILRHTDLFLPSIGEAAEIAGTRDVREMREIFRPYGIKLLAVKMGGEGAYVTNFREEYVIKAFPVREVVSTVGAGDAFVAGFLTGQVKGMNLYESALLANAAAAFTVGVNGAVGGVPDFNKLVEFISDHRKMIEN